LRPVKAYDQSMNVLEKADHKS